MDEPITAPEVHTILDELLPIAAERCSLELSRHGEHVVFEREGWIMATLLLITFDGAPGERSIRDIKEQEVGLIAEKCRDQRARLRASLIGWAAAVRRVFDVAPEEVATLMPHELVAPSLLQLRKPCAAADFEAAALAKSRLGKWLR